MDEKLERPTHAKLVKIMSLAADRRTDKGTRKVAVYKLESYRRHYPALFKTEPKK